MKKTKLLLMVLAVALMASCKSKPSNVNDPELKAMIDTMVRARVEKYVQAVLSQQQSSQSGSSYNDAYYRKMARKEAERAAGRAAQDRQSQEDATLNAQR